MGHSSPCSPHVPGSPGRRRPSGLLAPAPPSDRRVASKTTTRSAPAAGAGVPRSPGSRPAQPGIIVEIGDRRSLAKQHEALAVEGEAVGARSHVADGDGALLGLEQLPRRAAGERGAMEHGLGVRSANEGQRGLNAAEELRIDTGCGGDGVTYRVFLPCVAAAGTTASGHLVACEMIWKRQIPGVCTAVRNVTSISGARLDFGALVGLAKLPTGQLRLSGGYCRLFSTFTSLARGSGVRARSRGIGR